MITISTPSEQISFNTFVFCNPQYLPISFVIGGDTHTISKSDNGKYVLTIENSPFVFPFNKLANLLHSVYGTYWDTEWVEELEKMEKY